MVATVAGALVAVPLMLGSGGLQSLAATGTSTFAAAADTFVDQSRPKTNFGGSSVLRTDASPVLRSYLRFGVSRLTGPVSRATLRVFAQDASPDGFTVRGVGSATWGEKALTWATAPAPGPAVASSGALAAGQWTSVDVTGLVAGNGAVSLALTMPAGAAIRYASRESGAAHAAKLVVETTLSTTTTSPTTTSTTTTPTTQPVGGDTGGCSPSLTPRQAKYNLLGYLFGDGHWAAGGGYNYPSGTACRSARVKYELHLLGVPFTESGNFFHLAPVAPFNYAQDTGASPELAPGVATGEDIGFFLAGIIEGEGGTQTGEVLDDPNWGRIAAVIDLYKRVGIVVKPDHAPPTCGCSKDPVYWNTFVDPSADRTTYNGYISIIRSWSYAEMGRVPNFH